MFLGATERYTATLAGHHSARSQYKLNYGFYSAGISDKQKKEIVEGVKVPTEQKIASTSHLKSVVKAHPASRVKCGVG